MSDSFHPATVLILPGIQGSGPGHWQSLWERRDPCVRRVRQRDWHAPRLQDWLQELEAAVADARAPVEAVHELFELDAGRDAREMDQGVRGNCRRHQG